MTQPRGGGGASLADLAVVAEQAGAALAPVPIVEAMGDPSTPLWCLVLVAPVAAFAFVRWERRRVRQGRTPLLDVRLFSDAPRSLAEELRAVRVAEAQRLLRAHPDRSVADRAPDRRRSA